MRRNIELYLIVQGLQEDSCEASCCARHYTTAGLNHCQRPQVLTGKEHLLEMIEKMSQITMSHDHFSWANSTKRRYREDQIYLEANAPACVIGFMPFKQGTDVSIYKVSPSLSCGLMVTHHPQPWRSNPTRCTWTRTSLSAARKMRIGS